MQNAINYIPSPKILGQKVEGVNRTPGDIGNSLFRNFLNRSQDSEIPRNLAGNIFKRPELAKNIALLSSSGNLRNPFLRLNKNIIRLGINSDLALIPETAIPHLVKYLESLDIPKEKIDQSIREAMNSDGTVQIDRLMRRVLGKTGHNALVDAAASIHSRDVPRLEEMLVKMGLGINEVKEIIEKSTDGKGGIEISGLTGSLNKLFSGSGTEKEIISLLERFDISAKPAIDVLNTTDPDLKSMLTELSGKNFQDILKVIRNDISSLLSDKGIPPQEIKRFLETMRVEHTVPLAQKGSNLESGTETLMDQVVLKKDTEWADDKPQEKIIAILKNNLGDNEQPQVSKTYGRALSPGQEYNRLSINELIKDPDQKVKSDLLNLISERRGIISPETAGDKSKISITRRDGSMMKEITGQEFTGIKGYRDVSLQAENAIQIKNMINLPEPLPKILERMTWLINAGEQRSRIIIQPPELGRLDLELTLRNGHIQASVSAESTAVKELIEANLSQLKHQLSDQGFIVDKFEVMAGLDYQHFHEGHEWKAGSRRKAQPLKIGPKDNVIQVREISLKSTGMDLNQVDVHV